MLTWWILVARTWIGWGSSAESSLISRLGIPRGWRMGHLHLEKKYLIISCSKVSKRDVFTGGGWAVLANACAFSVDVVVTEGAGVGRGLPWPPGPELGFWLGSTWIRVAFHLKGIFALYAASTNTRSYNFRKKRVLKNVSMHTWSMILMHSAVGYFNNFRFILFN